MSFDRVRAAFHTPQDSDPRAPHTHTPRRTCARGKSHQMLPLCALQDSLPATAHPVPWPAAPRHPFPAAALLRRSHPHLPSPSLPGWRGGPRAWRIIPSPWSSTCRGQHGPAREPGAAAVRVPPRRARVRAGRRDAAHLRPWCSGARPAPCSSLPVSA